MPQQIFDFRKTAMECAQVENFCVKLKQISYLFESDTVQMFLDPRIAQPVYASKLDMHTKTQTSTLGDTLNRFKQCFNLLSGKEVD